MNASPTLLIVDDDVAFQSSVRRYAEQSDFDVRTASTLAQARAMPPGLHYNLVLLDLSLPDGSGLELLDTPFHADHIAVVTGQPCLDSAVRAVGSPVNEYLLKPIDGAALRALIERVALSAASDPQLSPASACGELLGQSPAMQSVFRCIRRIAPGDAPVLVHGERGTGKSLVARALHELGGRAGAFVELDCAAITPAQLACELSGDGQGGSRHGDHPAAGALARAAGGTLFLRHADALPLPLQARLAAMFRHPGAARTGAPDAVAPARIVVGCTGDARAAVDEGRLHHDLLYRLGDVVLALPPLREREGDAALLARVFLRRLNLKHGTGVRLANGSERMLQAHAWPGNVCELEQCIRRSYLLADDGVARIEPALLPRPSTVHEDADSLTFAVGTPFEIMQREMLLKTLAHYGNDRTRTARALGVSVKTVYNHLARLPAGAPTIHRKRRRDRDA